MSDAAPYDTIEPPAGRAVPPPSPSETFGLEPRSQAPAALTAPTTPTASALVPPPVPTAAPAPPPPGPGGAPALSGAPPSNPEIKPAAGAPSPEVMEQANGYIQRTMAIEGSGKDPNSSAVGGFIDGTWRDLVRKNVPELAGLPDDQVLAARADPVLRARMVAAYAKDNAAVLQQAGFAPDAAKLRMAHWFGPEGATRILKAEPGTSIDKLFPPNVIAANPILNGKTAGDVVDIVHKQMSAPTMREVANRESPALKEAYEAYEADAKRTAEQHHTKIESIMAQANKATPGSKERNEAIAELRREERKYKEEYDQISKSPPVMKPVDALANFGSIGTIVALIGGLFVRNHMTAALGAAGMAMQAINENNHDKFLSEYKTWGHQSTAAINMVRLHNEEIRSLLDDGRMAESEKMGRLGIMLQGLGMDRQADMIRLGAHKEVLSDLTKFALAEKSASRVVLDNKVAMAGMLEAHYLAQNPSMNPVEAKQKAQVAAGLLPKESAAEKPQIFTDPSQKDERGVPIQYTMIIGKPETAKTLEGQPFSPKGAQRVGTSSQSAPDPTAVENVAKAISELRMGPLTGQGIRTPWGQAVMNRVQELKPGYDAAEWAARVRGEIGFTAGKEAGAIRSFGVALDHLETMREAGEALKNGDVQTINRVRNRIRQEFGHEGPVDFNFIKSIVGGEVSKAVIGGVGALTDREELRQGFDAANSPEQMTGVIKMAKKLMAGQLEGYRQQARGIGWSDEKFDSHLGEVAKKELGEVTRGRAGGATPAAAPGAANSPPKVSNQAEYDALPIGSPYTAPDGKLLVKGK